jgi:hypothetical protein
VSESSDARSPAQGPQAVPSVPEPRRSSVGPGTSDTRVAPHRHLAGDPPEPPPSFPPRAEATAPDPADAAERVLTPDPASDPDAAVPAVPARRTGRGFRIAAALLAVSTALLIGSTAYLWRTSDAWEQRADDYEAVSHDLGSDLSDTRAELKATSEELEAVQSQLATAQARIIELANEKAQIGDDREAQRLLVDYQERVSSAAGKVALALDQCVRGQNQLIGYLQNAELYDPKDLDAYATDVQGLCQAATDANTALQAELSR